MGQAGRAREGARNVCVRVCVCLDIDDQVLAVDLSMRNVCMYTVTMSTVNNVYMSWKMGRCRHSRWSFDRLS